MKRVSYLLIPISIFGLVFLASVFQKDQARAQTNAAIIVNPTGGLITDENGSSDSFTVQLDSPAPPNVKIYFSSSDPSEGTVSPDSITLNPSNWDTPEDNRITVTGLPDGIEDGDVAYEIIGATSIGGPAEFSVSVTNINDSFPIANDDYPPIDGYSPIVIAVLDNDTALNNTPLNLSITSQPSDGTTLVNEDNTITYTPLETFAGIDQFSYRVCDADLQPDCASADVIIQDNIPPEILSVSVSVIGTENVFEVSGGEVTINVEASDNFQVDCVNFIRWDDRLEQYIQLGEVCESPYAITLNSSTLNYGWNQVYFQASDMAGNLSTHEFIWLLLVYRNYIPLVISH
ncbi:MAG: Ig-like domain-containing protein [Anaerolineales bacterium]